MTLQRRLWQLSGLIVGSYHQSWSIGAWFVIPFAIVGYVLGTWLNYDFPRAAFIAAVVAIPVVFLKARAVETSIDTRRTLAWSTSSDLFIIDINEIGYLPADSYGLEPLESEFIDDWRYLPSPFREIETS